MSEISCEQPKKIYIRPENAEKLPFGKDHSPNCVKISLVILRFEDMRKRKIIIILLLTIGFTFLFLILTPVRIGELNEAQIQMGSVQKIFKGGEKDIVFELMETERKFYINRGLEQGFELQSLRNELIGQEVIIRYPKYWTPFDSKKSIRHLSQLEHDGVIIYTEYK